jgi:hypothetical protein
MNFALKCKMSVDRERCEFDERDGMHAINQSIDQREKRYRRSIIDIRAACVVRACSCAQNEFSTSAMRRIQKRQMTTRKKDLPLFEWSLRNVLRNLP